MSLSFRCGSRRVMVLAVLSLLALSFAAVGCDDKGGETTVSAAEPMERSPTTPIVIPPGEPITIGVSAALTGADATLGIDSRDAAVVGIVRWKEENGDQIGGHDIAVHAEDDGCSDADITTKAAGHLLRGDDGHGQLPGLVGVLGPMCSAGATAVIPDYTKAGIVMISGSVTRTDVTLAQPEPKFFFRTAYTNEDQAAMQARYVIRQMDAQTIFVVGDSEAYGADLADAAQAALEEEGRSVTRASIERRDIDFSDLAGRVNEEDPDVVIFEGFNPEGALLYRQLRDAGYGGPFVSSDGVASVPDFLEPLGQLSESVVFSGCSAELPEEFLADYADIAGHSPMTPFVGQYADAATILLDSVARVATENEDGSLVIDPMELRDAVSTAQLPDGISGGTAFDENGDREGWGGSVGLVMCRIRGGRFVDFQI